LRHENAISGSWQLCLKCNEQAENAGDLDVEVRRYHDLVCSDVRTTNLEIRWALSREQHAICDSHSTTITKKCLIGAVCGFFWRHVFIVEVEKPVAVELVFLP